MSKKLFKERKFNLGIVESYKKATEKDSPILGSFSVKGMTVENMVSQNRTKYSPDVWAQPTSFRKSGKFLDENGKLKPATLFGSVDHPLDDRAELLLQEAAIAWYDVSRKDDGSWDGAAHILNNPNGRIVKTFLDYAKEFGGGELLGVSSRALGESVISESNGEQVEAIVPETFELMAFDFVYNPSFQTAVAKLNESVTTKKNVLAESVRSLAKDDEDHADVYKNFADKIEKIDKEFVNMKTKSNKFEGNSLSKAKQNYLKELRDQEKKLHDALYELKSMTDEEFAEKGQGDRGKIMKLVKKEYDEVLAEVQALEAAAEVKPAVQTEAKVEPEATAKIITEAEEPLDDLADLGEEMADELSEEKEEETEESEGQEELDAATEESEEETEEDVLTALKSELDTVKQIVQDLRDFLMPLEDAELEVAGEESEETDEESEETDEESEETDEESDESEETDEALSELSEEDLEELSEEELEYLANLDL